MSNFKILNKVLFGERFSNIHENVSKNNLLVDSYIINTDSIISSTNLFVNSNIQTYRELTNPSNEKNENTIPDKENV